MKKGLLLLIIVHSSWNIIAQSNQVKNDPVEFDETIMTDRPDQTECPSLTPKGWFQVETGYQREYDRDKETNAQTECTLFNSTLWKYGLSHNFELRVITEVQQDKYISSTRFNESEKDSTSTISGFSPIAVGCKVFVCEEKGIRPKTSLISHIELPYIASGVYKPNFIVPRFRFTMAHTLSERFTLSYNLGAEWEDGVSNATAIYTLALGFNLFKNFGGYIESYGFLKEKTLPDNRFNGGLTYLIGPNVQLDVTSGFGMSSISPSHFIGAGLSFRLNAFDKAH
jgi:hypothetical protein